jgi:protein-tyrosine-phosphatase
VSAQARQVLVVCTANVCRSAMAGAFLREHLRAAGLGHVAVASAGTHAQAGRPALPAAVAAVAAIGGDLAAHRATPLDIVSAREADLILCAAGEHLLHITSWWPDVPADRVRLFNESIAGTAPVDVDDPWGWDAEVFLLAARVIDRAMAAWARELAVRWPG